MVLQGISLMPCQGIDVCLGHSRVKTAQTTYVLLLAAYLSFLAVGAGIRLVLHQLVLKAP